MARQRIDRAARLDENRAYLASHRSLFPGGLPKSESYINRIAGQLRRQEARGLAPNLEAARGHIRTPEHPGRRRPNVPSEYLSQRRPRASKYSSYSATGIRKPKITRPLTHAGDRRRRAPLLLNDQSVLYTVPTEAEADTLLREAARHGDRVVMEVYDCTEGRHKTMFQNTRHGRGARADWILAQADENDLTLEQFLIWYAYMEGQNLHSSYTRTPPLSHICLYTLQVYPREPRRRAAAR